ncbi:MAG: type III-B CRISPR module RAMP protein Cmr4 [Trichodesmium sp. St5_bin2_1]|nr:type III-B CRISPR module RAMP protein Cmr4 [Trichodesmium sp. St5_bin2_1]
MENYYGGKDKMKERQNYLTYAHLITPLHTGGNTQEGNLMGIAREIHTEFPYLPSASLRGKIRSELEYINQKETDIFFGQKIKDGQQPTEGEVWFAEATLLFFPIASLNYHLVWITCPLWLERWNRWIDKNPLNNFIMKCREILFQKSAIVSFEASKIYLQAALMRKSDFDKVEFQMTKEMQGLFNQNGLIQQIPGRLIIVNDEDCIALVESGLQREVRVALEENSKTVKGGSFRSEESIPPEAIMFFPWGMKPMQKDKNKVDKNTEEEKNATELEANDTTNIREEIMMLLNDKLQFGGLEGLGRGWTNLLTINN